MSIRRQSINDGTTISKKMKRTTDERDSEVPRRGRGEQGKDWRTKNRKCIRCANARDNKRTGSPTENHSFTARKPTQRKNSRTSSCENKVEMQVVTWKVQGRELRGQEKFGVEHRTRRRDGARARDESGRTGPEGWRDSWKAQAHEHEYLPQREVVQWTKHANTNSSRDDSSTQQPDLTSRGGVLEECVHERPLSEE